MPLHVGVAGTEAVQMRLPPGLWSRPALETAAVWQVSFIWNGADRDRHKATGVTKELCQHPRDILLGKKIQGIRTDNAVRCLAGGRRWSGKGWVMAGHERARTASTGGTQPKGIIQQGATLCGCAEFFYMLLKVALVTIPGRLHRAGWRSGLGRSGP